MNQKWSETERQFIRENAGILTDSVIRDKLQQMSGKAISLQALRKQRQKLGILKLSGRGKCVVRPSDYVPRVKKEPEIVVV